MILFFTNQKRNSESVLKNQHKIKKNQYVQLKQMRDLVGVSKDMVLNKSFNISEFGKLLDKGWKIKKQNNKSITNKFIEKYYNTAIKNGAYGGKLLGAGNGGFLLFMANKFAQKKIIKSLKQLKKMYIRFDYSGTRITYFDKSGEEN